MQQQWTVEVLTKKERQNETQYTTRIGGKTSLCPSCFVKFSFPVTRLMPYYAETDRTPNRLTLHITLLICSLKCFDLYK